MAVRRLNHAVLYVDDLARVVDFYRYALGFEVRTILPATEPEIPRACAVVIDANPRTTYGPSESAALEAYLTRGGSLLLLYDLGFVIEPRLA